MAVPTSQDSNNSFTNQESCVLSALSRGKAAMQGNKVRVSERIRDHRADRQKSNENAQNFENKASTWNMFRGCQHPVLNSC